MLDVVWLNLVELSKQKTFREILSSVTSTEKEWKKWFDTDAPEEEDIPCGYQVHFHPLLIPDTLPSYADTRYNSNLCGYQFWLIIPSSGFPGCVSEATTHPILLP